MKDVLLSLFSCAIVILSMSMFMHRGQFRRYKKEYDSYLSLYQLEKQHRITAENEVESLRKQRDNYEYLLNRYLQRTQNLSDSEILEAVRYAVIKSHPDNGGNKDDFIKFNELYQKIKNNS